MIGWQGSQEYMDETLMMGEDHEDTAGPVNYEADSTYFAGSFQKKAGEMTHLVAKVSFLP